MLISITIENWKSYKDATELALYADRSRSHEETLARPAYYPGLRILPTLAIYGGNASGKSNLYDAIRFVQQFVPHGSQNSDSIPVQPFFDHGDGKPSRFSILALINQPGKGEYNPSHTNQKELIYRLDFTLDATHVISERLAWLDSQRNERTIYTRGENGAVTFDTETRNNLPPDSIAVLNVVARGTGPRRLFLTNTVDQMLPLFSHVLDWFRNVLRTADNSTEFTRSMRMMNDDDYCDRFGRILAALGTGVDSVGLEEVPASILGTGHLNHYRNVMAGTPEGAVSQLIQGNGQDAPRRILVLDMHEGKLRVRRVQTYRKGVPFGFENESSGTRRLLEILPIFTDLWGGENRTWVLDEIEREFHTELTQGLLTEFLDGCRADTRTQAIISTHDLMLMDQYLLRKDELVICERDESDASTLTRIGDFAGVRNDLDLRRSYLDGRFGGRPAISLPDLDEAVRG